MAVMKRRDIDELNGGGSEEDDASGCMRALTHTSSAGWRSERVGWEASSGGRKKTTKKKPADQTTRRDADGQEIGKHKQKDMNG